jgi:regulator of sigma E protease
MVVEALLLNVKVWTILIFLFSLSIFVHEFGHFIAARMLGLVVEAFSIGFGPAIWKKKHKGVLYRVGCLPLGGYVVLPQIDPTGMSRVQAVEDKEGEPAAEKRPIPPVAPWKRAVVSLAGATGNVVLAVLLAWIVYKVGIPAGPEEFSAQVGWVDTTSKAYESGLRPGDVIESICGRPVSNWNDFRMEVALRQSVDLKVRNPDGVVTALSLPTSKGLFGEMTLAGVDSLEFCAVLRTEPGMAADKAGMKAGDVITEFGGRPVYSQAHLISLVQEFQNKKVKIKVLRSDTMPAASVDVEMVPVYDPVAMRARIGIQFNTVPVDRVHLIHPTPMSQIRRHSSAIFRFLRALVTPSQSRAASQAVGGPVAIIVSYVWLVKASLMLAIWFTGFLNVNLAIINLLPIPVLDGGHIVFILWEAATRRPVPEKVATFLVNMCMVLLLGLIAVLSVRDVDRFTSVRALLRKMTSKHANAVPAVSTNAAADAVAAPVQK